MSSSRTGQRARSERRRPSAILASTFASRQPCTACWIGRGASSRNSPWPDPPRPKSRGSWRRRHLRGGVTCTLFRAASERCPVSARFSSLQPDSQWIERHDFGVACDAWTSAVGSARFYDGPFDIDRLISGRRNMKGSITAAVTDCSNRDWATRQWRTRHRRFDTGQRGPGSRCHRQRGGLDWTFAKLGEPTTVVEDSAIDRRDHGMLRRSTASRRIQNAGYAKLSTSLRRARWKAC